MIQQVEILLVEDNPGDIRLTKEALKEWRISNNLHVVTDGVNAMDFLYKRGSFVNAPTPDIILLDLNMPRKNGFEVLKEIKGDDILNVIPVIILTTSQAEKEILLTYQLHANCFVAKPVEFETFFEAMRTIEDFWLTIVKLPKL